MDAVADDSPIAATLSDPQESEQVQPAAPEATATTAATTAVSAAGAGAEVPDAAATTAIEEPRVSRSLFRKKAPPAPRASEAPSSSLLPSGQPGGLGALASAAVEADPVHHDPVQAQVEPIRSIVDEVKAEIDEWKARNATRKSNGGGSARSNQDHDSLSPRRSLSPTKKKRNAPRALGASASRLAEMANQVHDKERRLEQKRLELAEQKKRDEQDSLVSWTDSLHDEIGPIRRRMAPDVRAADSQIQRNQVSLPVLGASGPLPSICSDRLH